MKTWLKQNMFLGIMIVLYLLFAIWLLPDLKTVFNKSYFEKSILKVMADAFLSNYQFAASLSLLISFVLALAIMIYHAIVNDNTVNLIRRFVFVQFVVLIYVFICVLAFLAITPSNGEAIIALLGFIYGFSKYLPLTYNLIYKNINENSLKDTKKKPSKQS